MSHEVPTTVGGLLDRAADRWPDRVALVHGDRRLTYTEVHAMANQVAHALLRRGVRKGDRVGYLGRNTIEYFLVFWGAAKAAAVFVPLNWRLSTRELGQAIAQTTPSIMFATPDFAAAMTDVAADLPLVTVAGGGDDQSLAALVSEEPRTDPGIAVAPDDVALILLTSGTTGAPKGAMLTGDSMVFVRTSQPETDTWSRWGDDETLLLSMPLFHIGGVALSINSLLYGARIVMLEEFEPRTVLETVARHRVTRFFIVPSALKRLLQEPDIATFDFGHVRCVSYGASPISPDLLAAGRDVFGGKFVQNYGITETSGTIAVLPAADHATGGPRLLSAGRPLAGVEVKVVDEDGREVPTGTHGQVLIRSRAVMKGYWQDPEATAEALDADGWFRSGDAGHLDADGYIYLGARLNDVIISGGENIYPREVEDELVAHPAVADAAVFGIPDDRWGEAVRAEVVLAGATRLDADELAAWLRPRLASYKIPKSIGFCEELPRNAVGKVLRRSLREPYWSHLGRDVG